MCEQTSIVKLWSESQLLETRGLFLDLVWIQFEGKQNAKISRESKLEVLEPSNKLEVGYMNGSRGLVWVLDFSRPQLVMCAVLIYRVYVIWAVYLFLGSVYLFLKMSDKHWDVLFWLKLVARIEYENKMRNKIKKIKRL